MTRIITKAAAMMERTTAAMREFWRPVAGACGGGGIEVVGEETGCEDVVCGRRVMMEKSISPEGMTVAPVTAGLPVVVNVRGGVSRVGVAMEFCCDYTVQYNELNEMMLGCSRQLFGSIIIAKGHRSGLGIGIDSERVRKA
jgi:hypothetical protein